LAPNGVIQAYSGCLRVVQLPSSRTISPGSPSRPSPLLPSADLKYNNCTIDKINLHIDNVHIEIDLIQRGVEGGGEEAGMHTVIGQCPVCEGELEVARLHCRACGTSIEGQFALGRFHSLSKEQLRFAEVFIKNRGNIKDVERELGISYPTVRGRLDALIRAMGYDVPEEPKSAAPDRRKEVLAQLERGEIDSEEAVRLLRAR
jgi:hypothetical protein